MCAIPGTCARSVSAGRRSFSTRDDDTPSIDLSRHVAVAQVAIGRKECTGGQTPAQMSAMESSIKC